jgi:hypothetical protein
MVVHTFCKVKKEYLKMMETMKMRWCRPVIPTLGRQSRTPKVEGHPGLHSEILLQ